MGQEYPKREQYFAHRFCRLLLKCCVANEHGQDVAMLLVAVAMTEDSKRYTGPVTFWNEQLVPLIGAANVKALQRARIKAVESGWLHYDAGARGRPAMYWVTIPDGLECLSDAPMGCEQEELRTDSKSISTRNTSSIDELRTDSRAETTRNTSSIDDSRAISTRNLSSVCPQSVHNVSNILTLPDPLSKKKEEADAAQLVASWSMPPNAGERRHRQALAAWQCVRKREHGSYLDEISWEAAAMKYQHLSPDEWHAALMLSVERQSKGLCVRDYRDEQSRAAKSKPKQTKPRLLTDEEIERYNATGELPEGALDPIGT